MFRRNNLKFNKKVLKLWKIHGIMWKTGKKIYLEEMGKPNCIVAIEVAPLARYNLENFPNESRVVNLCKLRSQIIKKNMISIQLKRANINLLDATEYLIELYKATNQKYRCTTTKLGKLLSIAEYIAAKNGIRLFEQDLINQNCGTTFSQLSSEYNYKIYEDKDCDAMEEICENEVKKNVSPNLNPSVAELLYHTFLKFGKYPAHNIGRLIDEFKDEILTDGTLDFEKAYTRFNSLSCDKNCLEKYIIESQWSYSNDAL